MKIVIVADDLLKEELLNKGVDPSASIIWLSDIIGIKSAPEADVYMDLLFEHNESRIDLLKHFLPKLVIINSVNYSLKETDSSFVRINGWITFLQSQLIEASAAEDKHESVEKLFSLFNKKPEWLPDSLGFVAPRIITMIINEAFIILNEGVSSQNEIDQAMKTGTNYPYGPFEWAHKIGVHHVSSLANKLGINTAIPGN